MDWLSGIMDVEGFGWRDALDIAFVAGLVYGTILLLRRTRGAPVAVGVLVFVLLWQVSQWLELQTLGTLLDVAVTALPLVIVLLFQNTLRRAFMTIGRNPLFRFFAPPEEDEVVESVTLAAMSLASQRVGAIIVIEREVGLRTFIASGIALDARVSYELLLALFHPRSPLHDGAVILSHGRLAAAACMLPLTTKPQLSVKYGSRHRAAIGLSEDTDAIVVVVSEERGVISLVRDGEIRALEAKELRELLRRELTGGPATRRRPFPARA